MCLFFRNRFSSAGTFEKKWLADNSLEWDSPEGRDIGFFDMRYDLTNGEIEEGIG